MINKTLLTTGLLALSLQTQAAGTTPTIDIQSYVSDSAQSHLVIVTDMRGDGVNPPK
jgi:hypothetical protein